MFKFILLLILGFLVYWVCSKYFSIEGKSKTASSKTTFKNYIFILLLSFNIQSLVAQVKDNNIIILWDVTASMVGSTPSGYNAAHDIDKNVRVGLRRLIGDLENDNSTIRIFPFTTKILDYSQKYSSNASGKASAITYINDYKIDPKIKGYTNICSAWEMAHKYIDKSKSNYIYLYTDGEQNTPYGEDGKNCMQGLIDKYCELTKGACFTYFISIDALNDNLIFPPECGVKISVTGDEPIAPPKSLNLSLLNTSIVHNIKDGLSQVIRFKKIGTRKLNGFIPKGNISFANPAYSFDVKFTLVKEYEDGTADFKVSFIDFSQNTVKRMKGVQKLNEKATLTLESDDKEVTFDPKELEVVFKYEKPKPVQKVTIKID